MTLEMAFLTWQFSLVAKTRSSKLNPRKQYLNKKKSSMGANKAFVVHDWILLADRTGLIE